MTAVKFENDDFFDALENLHMPNPNLLKQFANVEALALAVHFLPPCNHNDDFNHHDHLVVAACSSLTWAIMNEQRVVDQKDPVTNLDAALKCLLPPEEFEQGPISDKVLAPHIHTRTHTQPLTDNTSMSPVVRCVTFDGGARHFAQDALLASPKEFRGWAP